MPGTIDSIKDRLDIVEVLGSYIKLEKAGKNYKGKCPFHNEKTASFSVSQNRQGYYCFGCGAKGDIFTFVQEMEGVDFKGALKILAERAGVELEVYRGTGQSKEEKDKLLGALEDATLYFENNLKDHKDAQDYLKSRGITDESIKEWRLGLALDEWRSLFDYLKQLGYLKDILIKAGLIKQGEDLGKEAYDVFRNRIVFPIFDQAGKVIAFSGRSLEKDALAKYLNTPETSLFNKSEVLYGLDKAKDEIRKKNFTVLVEGQIDLVLSHQAGVKNTVASSGTAFTAQHLGRLKRLSTRILLAFDGDVAGEKAAEKSAILGLSLGMEVKVAKLPEGSDPADMVKNNPEAWKDILRNATHSIEYALNKIINEEKDRRKLGKLIEKKILPLLTLLESSIEKSHFISLIAKKSGIKEEILWDDLRKTKIIELDKVDTKSEAESEEIQKVVATHKERIEARLIEVKEWQKEFTTDSKEFESLKKEEEELTTRLVLAVLLEERQRLVDELHGGGDEEKISKKIHEIDQKRDVEKQKLV
jgi:DNA primase